MKKKILIALFMFLLTAVYIIGNDEALFGKEATEQEILSFKTFLKEHGKVNRWKRAKNFTPKATREMLLESFEKGRGFLLNNQKPEGNFNYNYDFTAREFTVGDNQVRQAGALWGLATCHQFAPTKQTDQALRRGFNFFFKNSKPYGKDGLVIYYPASPIIMTGTVSLVSLAIIDYLRTEEPQEKEYRDFLLKKLDGYINFLLSQQLKSGHFSLGVVKYIHLRIGKGNQYFNGETLLALTKAAKYLDRKELVPFIEKATFRLAIDYTQKAWREDEDSKFTKGFYQWGSMSFWEYQDAGWKESKLIARTTLSLAWWMIYTHKTLDRTRNTGYAYEGMIHAYLIAKKKGGNKAASRIRRTIDKGLFKLTSWQVEGPLVKKNKFLRKNRTDDPLAIGGVMNHKAEPGLRIDVTQHQMHGVILALKYVYTE